MPATISAVRGDLAPEIVSPLLLSHQLLSMAEEAHRAGMPQSATRLLRLAHSVCTDRPGRCQ